MKILTILFVVILILNSCGRKSEPKYQGELKKTDIQIII